MQSIHGKTWKQLTMFRPCIFFFLMFQTPGLLDVPLLCPSFQLVKLLLAPVMGLHTSMWQCSSTLAVPENHLESFKNR